MRAGAGDSEYFESAYTLEELGGETARVSEEIEAEGMVLLKNEDGCLPLGPDQRLSLFSESTVDMLYSGTGSGQVSTADVPTLRQAFESAGYAVNDTLWSFYEETTGSTCASGCPWNPFDNAQGVYRSERVSRQRVYRRGQGLLRGLRRRGGLRLRPVGGEQNDLNLTSDERRLLSLLTDDGAGVLQMLRTTPRSTRLSCWSLGQYAGAGLAGGLLKIQACLWIGYVGQGGLNAMAKAFTGEVNPSGKLPDTIAYHPAAAPAALNYGRQHLYQHGGN